MNKLDICKSTRKIAADSLLTTLKKLLSNSDPISEVTLRDAWLEELRKYKEIFPSGWYDPPPFGIVVLFASKNYPNRADFVNLRPEEFWPKKDILLDKNEGYAYLFASPVNKKTGLIGDFAINIYFGKDQTIKNHLQTSLAIDKQIFAYIKTGMRFSEIFKFANKLFDTSGLRNNIVSITNPDGVNVGHTIPASYKKWSKEESEIVKGAEINWDVCKNMISKKRVFLSVKGELKVKKDLAFTIEPALKITSDETIPMSAFHTTVLINKNGEKELLTNFDEIFRLVGMDYMRGI